MLDRFFKALCIAIEAHNNAVDRGGEMYILHPIFVASHMDTEDEMSAALLHDVVEDTPITLDRLSSLGFADIVPIIDNLTRRRGEAYEAYLERVKSHPISLKVKMWDMKHNSDRSRLKKISEKDEERFKKYDHWLPILEKLYMSTINNFSAVSGSSDSPDSQPLKAEILLDETAGITDNTKEQKQKIFDSVFKNMDTSTISGLFT